MKQSSKSTWGWALFTLLCGTLYPLALSPFDLPIVGIMSVSGLVLALNNTTPRQLFLRSLIFGLGLFGTGASWVYVSIHTYGQAPVALALVMTSAFVLLLALCFAAPFAPLAWLLRLFKDGSQNHKSVITLLAFPSLWVLSEWFRGWFLTGFPWLYLGNSHIDTWLAGWAPLGGVLALSWIAAFTATTIALFIIHKSSRAIQLCAALITLSFWAGGLELTQKQWTTAEKNTLSVALMQPRLSLDQKWDRESLERILALYRQETEKHWGKDLIIWPESAIPRFQRDVRYYLQKLDKDARKHHSTLITGIPTRTGQGTYNSVIALGESSGIYHKRHLVPFGEYLPLEQWLRGTIRFFDLPMSTFSSGTDQQPLLMAGKHPIATAICYEIVYQDLVAASAADAKLLLTVSNDTWFGASIGPHQHFQMARMRALENGKPLLRGTNDGITAIIDSKGKVISALPQFERGVLQGKITPHSGSTPFNRFQSWPVVIFSLLILIGLLAFFRLLPPLNKATK